MAVWSMKFPRGLLDDEGGPECKGTGEQTTAETPSDITVTFTTMTFDWSTGVATFTPRVPGCADPATEPTP